MGFLYSYEFSIVKFAFNCWNLVSIAELTLKKISADEYVGEIEEDVEHGNIGGARDLSSWRSKPVTGFLCIFRSRQKRARSTQVANLRRHDVIRDNQRRRLLSLVAVLDRMDRRQAARIYSVDCKTLHDWVHRFNKRGPTGSTISDPRDTHPSYRWIS